MELTAEQRAEAERYLGGAYEKFRQDRADRLLATELGLATEPGERRVGAVLVARGRLGSERYDELLRGLKDRGVIDERGEVR